MVGPVGHEETIAAYASLDGGRSWYSRGELTMPPGITYANDVTVAYDQFGRGYVCAMGTSGQSRDDRGVWLWTTRDAGRSFRPAEAAVSGVFVDHPWLAAGAGGLHVAWVAQDHAALGYTRCVAGARFEDPRVLPILDGDGVDSPMSAAGREGQVCVVYAADAGPVDPDEDKGEGRGEPGDDQDATSVIRVVCSIDEGRTFADPVTLGVSSTRIVLPGGVIASSGPTVAAAPHGPDLYAAYPVHDPGAGHSDIVVTTSDDGGTTWSQPRTATPRDGAVYFQPQLAVDVRGRVVLSAFALRDSLIDLVVLSSPGDARLCFGAPRPVTTTPFDPAIAADGNPKHGAWWIGDYQGLAATPDAIHAVWNDTRTGNLELFSAKLRLSE